jgi:hypothetical protein
MSMSRRVRGAASATRQPAHRRLQLLHTPWAVALSNSSTTAPAAAPAHPPLEEQEEQEGHAPNDSHEDECVEQGATQLLARAVRVLRV